MESQRNLLLIGFLLVSFLLYQQWVSYSQPDTAPVETSLTTPSATDALPSAQATGGEEGIPDIAPAAPQAPAADDTLAPVSRLITVTTDKLRITIDTLGGDVVHADLMEFPLTLDSDDPFVLLHQSNQFRYIAQSGLTGFDTRDNRPLYAAAQQNYTLADGEDMLAVPLSYQRDDGVMIAKVFKFSRGKHSIDVDFRIHNGTSQPLSTQVWAQLRQTMAGEGGSMLMPTYRGAAYSTADSRYEKFSFDDMSEKKLNKQTQGGWVAMLQHYFVSAWVPGADDNNEIYSSTSNGQGIIGFIAPATTIAAGADQTLNTTLFVGPKDQDALSALSPTLNLVVDYGFLWMLAQPLHWLLVLFQSWVVNWGIAIILITLTVKGSMYRLTKAQFSSMAKMRKLQPKMAALKERYGDDRQKMSQAMMEMYKKEKVNPMGGCLPILIQMPIFIALYWVLLESYELRQAPFFLWIDDLSVQDPYYVLPLLMGASMWLMQKMSPNTITDPTQQKVMQFMPVIFTFMFLWFPSGLVLYWLVSNLISIAQQWYIYRQMDKADAKA
ncbi:MULTISPECIES: membrane protein insertase YidC [Corallincola]|uniref:Membrane protein insertase YidC n=3 Tax=Corallincola TaxID=1775176 RepID=A0A368N5Y6_9GAMM|nr:MULTISPECIES: membrane protein insertase YidC [Corallincola]RCU45413.1 membrane protein insertase YidC [Corallincola holothuriorum]TAA41077.1 membrane protein insertase YidC [Corallincola spongiicola]TCI02729.1 membrane protein insertase YidC [Corallincola luteus]